MRSKLKQLSTSRLSLKIKRHKLTYVFNQGLFPDRNSPFCLWERLNYKIKNGLVISLNVCRILFFQSRFLKKFVDFPFYFYYGEFPIDHQFHLPLSQFHFFLKFFLFTLALFLSNDQLCYPFSFLFVSND